MAKFSIIAFDSEGVAGKPIETTGRNRVVRLDKNQSIRVKPKNMEIEVMDRSGDIVSTLQINSLPDQRIFHKDLFHQILSTGYPKIIVDIIES